MTGIWFGVGLTVVGFFGFGTIGVVTALDPTWALWGMLPGAAVMAVSGYQHIKQARGDRPRASRVREDPENAPPADVRRHRPEH